MNESFVDTDEQNMLIEGLRTAAAVQTVKLWDKSALYLIINIIFWDILITNDFFYLFIYKLTNGTISPKHVVFLHILKKKKLWPASTHTQTHSSCSTVATRGQTLHTVPLNILQSVFADYQTDLSDTQWDQGLQRESSLPPTLHQHSSVIWLVSSTKWVWKMKRRMMNSCWWKRQDRNKLMLQHRRKWRHF